MDDVVLKEHPDSIEITMTQAVEGGGHVPPFRHMRQELLQVALNYVDEVKELLYTCC